MIRTVNGFNTCKSHGFLVLHPGAKGNRLITWQPKKRLLQRLKQQGSQSRILFLAMKGILVIQLVPLHFALGRSNEAMAKCRVDSMDDLLQTLENAADVDSISEEMLTEGAQVLQKNIREEITSAADRGYATGELASSVIPDTPEKNAFGHYVSVRPVGIDSKGVRNGEKWGYLENGNGGNQKPHPFEDRATKRSETECTEKMQEVFNRHINI